MMELLIGIVIGMVAGYHFGIVHSMMKLKEFILKEAKIQGIQLDEETNIVETSHVKKLMIEEINNVLYLYERDNNEFVCQGSSVEELAKLADQHKNIKYASVLSGKKVYAFINGKVEIKYEG